MHKILAGAAALSVLALSGAIGPAKAQQMVSCAWAGNHWDCDGSYVYPKFYPYGTIMGDQTISPVPIAPPTPADIGTMAPPDEQQP
jgi:hypothetical protein